MFGEGVLDFFWVVKKAFWEGFGFVFFPMLCLVG